jgi:hypothetical protein
VDGNGFSNEIFWLLEYNTIIWWKSKRISEENVTCYLLHGDFWICLLFIPEDGGDMFLLNVN